MKTEEIIKAIATIEQRHDDGEIEDDVFSDSMESLNGEIENKLDAMAYMVEDYENDLAVMKKEAERLKTVTANIKNQENKIKDLKQFMAYFLDSSDKKKVTTEKHIYSARNYRQSVMISSDAKVPSEFMKVKTDTYPDKTALYKALKAGETFDGIHLKDNRQAIIK